MNEIQMETVLHAIAELRGIVEDAAKAAMNAREIAAEAVQAVGDSITNLEAVRNDVAAHTRLDTEQHAHVSAQVEALAAQQEAASLQAKTDRAEIKAQLADLTEVKQFWTNAKGAKAVLVGVGGILVAIGVIGTAALWIGSHIVDWWSSVKIPH